MIFNRYGGGTSDTLEYVRSGIVEGTSQTITFTGKGVLLVASMYMYHASAPTGSYKVTLENGHENTVSYTRSDSAVLNTYKFVDGCTLSGTYFYYMYYSGESDSFGDYELVENISSDTSVTKTISGAGRLEVFSGTIDGINSLSHETDNGILLRDTSSVIGGIPFEDGISIRYAKAYRYYKKL